MRIIFQLSGANGLMAHQVGDGEQNQQIREHVLDNIVNNTRILDSGSTTEFGGGFVSRELR